MIRITTSTAETGTVLRIAGQLTDDAVRELERHSSDVEWPLILDLSELRKMDEGGRATLRELVARGAELVDVPPYITLLLERA